jgi:hypothetical protein
MRLKSILGYEKVKALPLFEVSVIAASLMVGVVLVTQRQLFNQKAATNKTASLTFSTSKINVVPGGTCSVGVNLSTGGQGVRGADIMVEFNKSKQTFSGFTKSSAANVSNVFKVVAPIKTDCSIDTSSMVASANANGVVQIGLIAADPGGTNCALPSPMASGALTGPFNDSGSVGILTFIAKPSTGDSTMGFKYSAADATTDSNVLIAALPTGTTAGSSGDILAAPSSTVTVSYCYDYAGGNSVNVGDIQQVAAAYNQTSSQPSTKYQAKFDLNNNGKIDIGDIQPVAGQYGKSCL